MENRPLAVESENDLISREGNDNFWIKRIFKFVLLIIAIIIIILLAGMFCWEMFNDSAYRTEVLELIKQQIGTLVVSALAILGIGTFPRNR